MKKSILSGLVIISLSGCVSMHNPGITPISMRTAFSEQEHAAWTGSGDSAIEGQAFLRQRGGGVVTCAGQRVLLFPNTPYFQEVVSIARGGGQPATPPGADAVAVTRNTMCDAEGRFRFDALPAGSWIVGTEVTWQVGYEPQGGAVVRTVSVDSGKTVSVLLSDGDRK